MLRDMISGIPEKQMDLGDYYVKNGEACNTIACIAGWAAIYPPFVKQGLEIEEYLSRKSIAFRGCTGQFAAAKFFGVDYREFSPRQSSEHGTNKEIALRRLDRLLT